MSAAKKPSLPAKISDAEFEAVVALMTSTPDNPRLRQPQERSMIIDADKLKGKQTREALESAIAELADRIENVSEALTEAGDTGLDAEDREDWRETAVTALDELFGEFEAFQRICEERLTVEAQS